MAGILAVVTTSGGAAGIHNRFTRNLAGTPLIAYTLKECDKAKHIQRCILSTDSKEVARAAGLYSAQVIFRPAELSGDNTPLEEIVKHALGELKNTEGYEPALVVVLPGTFPLRRAAAIDEAVEKMEQTGADSVVGVCPAPYPPSEMVTLDGDRALALLPDAGERQRVYRVSGAVYVLKPAILLEQGKLRGPDTRAIVMSASDSVEVISRYSFMQAEHAAKDRKKNILR